jgi:hypothetical protein
VLSAWASAHPQIQKPDNGIVIIATCLVAAFLPARRAARIDPIATLRAD